MRVHELAKLLEISSKDCLERLHSKGIEAKSHMSAIDEAVAGQFLETESGGGAKAAPEAAAAPSPEPEAAAEAAPAAAAVAVAEEPEAPPADAKKVIRVKGAIVVKELAELLGVRPNKLITELMSMNILSTITQKVELTVIKSIVEKHGFEFEHEKRTAEHQPTLRKRGTEEAEEADNPEDLQPRSPVVTFLGHVDHGKTSLMDQIRKTTVVSGEHGGITQHIGAYTVDVSGRRITFLDTPGHAAFTAMRARGANLTDIAVIVIAADDGIMPQTEEAIQHARAANVSLIIAINKTDLPAANVDRVKQQLQAADLAPEDWGGDVICCSVSAETGDGIDHLLEMILLQADVSELKANPDRRATGYVVEAELEPGKGPTASLLVTNGTLKVGDFLLCGPHCGKARALIDDHGRQIKSAPPSTPVKLLGLSGVPEAGAQFRVYANERAARTLAQETQTSLKQEQLAAPMKASLDTLFDQLEGDKKLDLRVVIKADTQGSIEAITHALGEIKSNKITLNILLGATGNITENDVMLASASNAVVLGFQVAKEPGVDAACKREGVELRLHNVIYELIDQVHDAMVGLLAPELRETVVGTAEVLEVFPMSKTAKVAGCRVTKGNITPKYRVRVRRGDEILFDGSIMSLKHFQDEVAEVREAQECGIRLSKFNDFDKSDVLEFYEVEAFQQTL